MEKKTESIHPDQWLKDLPPETEIQSFSAEAMIECEKCGRKSPPTRLKCLYCGTDLQISAEQSVHLKPSLRKLEEWEKGFNLILKPVASKAENLPAIADLLHLEKDDVQKIFDTNLSLPLARAETIKEAEVLAMKLNDYGIETRIIEDESLITEKMPRRLRGLELFEDRLILILFNADEVAEISYEDVALIVKGVFFERKVEAVESLKKKDEKKILASRELSSDEMVIDLYSRTDQVGYRIESKGFDFSCLGGEKSLFAKENMPKLIEKIQAVSPRANYNSEYLKIREELGKVWGLSERNDSSGLERKGLGGLKRTNITTVNNFNQFTRYSRLQWHLL